MPERPRRPRPPLLTAVEGPTLADATPPIDTAWLEVERAKIAAAHEQFANLSRQLAQRDKQLDARAAALNRVASMYAAAAKMLAIRAQLCLALIAAFVLSIYAMAWQSSAALYVLIAWCALTLLPLVGLEFNTRRMRPSGQSTVAPGD